ncbi:hypothetical protein QFZ28_005467 [Neobacillus niacini]|nr:hypothetical protein [Neobacillus niacini]
MHILPIRLVFEFLKWLDTGLNFEKLLNATDYAASISSKKPLGRNRHVERKH